MLLLITGYESPTDSKVHVHLSHHTETGLDT